MYKQKLYTTDRHGRVYAEWIEETPDDPVYAFKTMQQLVRDAKRSGKTYKAHWVMKVVRAKLARSVAEHMDETYRRILERGGKESY